MGWPLKSIGELGHVSRGRSRHRPRDAEHLYGGQYPFIQTADVKHSSLYITEYSQTYNEDGLAQSKLWNAGTLCITIAANIADTAILGIDACFPDSVIGFIPKPEKADARFIKYLFDALLQRRFQRFTQGAAQDNLSQEKLLSLKFPTPDLRTQKRIADILSTYDDLIENNRRRIQLLEQSARLLYKEWFVRLRFPGYAYVKIKDGVPEGWTQKTINELSSYLNRGITPKYDDDSTGIVVNQKCVRERLVNLDLARRQAKEVPKGKLVKFGDVLVNSTGEGTLGRVAQLTFEIENCTVDSHITIVRPAKGVPVYYFGLYLTSLESYFSTMGRGATNQTELSRSTIGDISMLVPASVLAKEFEGLVDPIYQQINRLIVQNKKLTEARDLLLLRLMNGEIEV
ncbi:MAG: restriction endonuclease subunit S [Deltaproteobacteria bacterium]|nr:MAG: restriction endonuclease subunit S [Deltaproteobacteria bacterium]RPJ17771.1 MAG: restriction endonuclease subunit S [Deltaproteobacteria bacterium]